MMERIDGVADPDVNIFNVAKPDRPRLPVFSQFCPLDTPEIDKVDKPDKSSKKVNKRKTKAPLKSKRSSGYDKSRQWENDQLRDHELHSYWGSA